MSADYDACCERIQVAIGDGACRPDRDRLPESRLCTAPDVALRFITAVNNQAPVRHMLSE
jgi:hypothetical protein